MEILLKQTALHDGGSFPFVQNLQKVAVRSKVLIVVCDVCCCTARSPSPGLFIQGCTSPGVPVTFFRKPCPVNEIRHGTVALFFLSGLTGHVTMPPPESCDIFWEKCLIAESPLRPRHFGFFLLPRIY